MYYIQYIKIDTVYLHTFIVIKARCHINEENLTNVCILFIIVLLFYTYIEDDNNVSSRNPIVELIMLRGVRTS